jgi:hypothetical protein
MKTLWLAFRAWLDRLALEVRAARAPEASAPELPTFAVKTPGTQEVIELPQLKTFDHPPTPEETRAEARRIALAYARQRSGKPELTWKQAKLLLDRWEKEEREQERAVAKRREAVLKG